MNQLEIREKISENNKLIADLFTPNQFTLNNTVAALLKENENLQSLCQHEFQEGYCIWCDLEEKK